MGTEEAPPARGPASVEQLNRVAGDASLQNTREAFARTLKEGHYNELKVALFFMLKGFHVNIGFRRGRYDLDVLDLGAGKRFSVEVKWDRRAGGTGNLYFESRNTRQDKPSGLFSSDADYWCHVLGSGTDALFGSTSALRRTVPQLATRTVSTRGADSNSEGHLVPAGRLKDLPSLRWITLPTVEEFFGQIFRGDA